MPRSTIPTSTPSRSPQLTSGIPEVRDRILDRRLQPPAQLRLLHLGVQGLVRARPVAGGVAAGPPGAARQGRRRRGLRLLAANLAGRGRRAADLGGDPVDPRLRPGLRDRRGDQGEGAGLRPLHRGAELARLRRAAGDGDDRPRPRREPQRADQRRRQHAGPLGRRRLDRPVRPRFQQLRHHHPGAGLVPRTIPRRSASSSSAPPPARWCR